MLGNPARTARRLYHRSRRYRRFVRADLRLRRQHGWRGLSLTLAGFRIDKLHLYPDVRDRALRALYVNDLTASRYRLFNGASGALLTNKQVLLPVIAQRSPWRLEYYAVPAGVAESGTRLRYWREVHRLEGVFLALRSRDTMTPFFLDLRKNAVPRRNLVPVGDDGEEDEVTVEPTADVDLLLPRGHVTLLRLDADADFHDADWLRPHVLQVTTYWDPATGQPFAGSAVIRRSLDARGSWPRLNGTEVLGVDAATGEAREMVRFDRPGGARRSVRAALGGEDAGVPNWAEVHGWTLGWARRFPSLRAVSWYFLQIGGRYRFVDASNHLRPVYGQLHGPLLRDPRVRAAYQNAGVGAQTTPLRALDLGARALRTARQRRRPSAEAVGAPAPRARRAQHD